MSRPINYSDSMNDTVSTLGPVLQTFINRVVKEEMPNCNAIYDPQLSYDSALVLFREQNAKMETTRDPLPMFAFSRSALRYPELAPALHRRTANNIGYHKVNEDTVFTYAMTYAEVEIQFLYVNKNMKEVEQFEINYLANEGITGSREITVNLPDLGDFNYHIDYNDILEIDANKEGAYQKGLAGSLTIRGFFFVFRSETGLIKEINARIYQMGENIINNSTLLSVQQIKE